ncbi:spermatogenesis-associated protein 31E1 isoform X1 [Cricetulus griseus]|uniref:spermatogenesis-associated protein 31E1 isoform X1 n=1 Tax=Cricetulus griseus TaxID=10029 RepID=UPI0015C32649|nr:spermatogenesis-associated protein 31E1 isoform X1 [Cricetulus griseus]
MSWKFSPYGLVFTVSKDAAFTVPKDAAFTVLKDAMQTAVTQWLESYSASQKMETALLQLRSIPWMKPSSIFMHIDWIFYVVCGVGLFLLLILLLKTYPVSPSPGSGENTPKAKRETGDEERREQDQEDRCFCKSPSKHPLLDSTPQAFWNSNEKLDQLPLPQLLSYLKFLEDLMQQKFSRISWGMSTMLSESVVATAWVSKRPCSKTVRFSDSCGPFPDLPMAQGPSKISQAQPLPHQLLKPRLACMTEAQTLNNLPSSTPNQLLSSSTSRAHVKAGSTNRTEIQASLLTENQPWQQDLEWKDTIVSNIQTCQTDISQPTHNFPGDTLPTEPISSASILSGHPQFLQHHEESRSEYRVTEVREQHGSPSRFLPSQELTQLQGHFPANSPFQPKDKPDLPQPAQPSINSKSHKLMGSVPSGMPLKEGPGKHDPIKEDLGFKAKDLPCTSSSRPGKGLKPRNPALRTDQWFNVNTTQDLSFLDPKIQRKLESNIMQLHVKRRCRPHLYTLSKAECYSKAAMILEKLHHRDPGGSRVETVPAARLQSPLFAHSPSEVQEMQRATPPAASYGPSKAHPVTLHSYLSTETQAFCFQARTQPSRTVRGTGRGILHTSTSPRMPTHAPWNRFENVVLGHPCWNVTMLGPQERVPPSVAKQTNRSEEKEERPPAWKVSLGSMEIPNGQAINIHLTDFESTEANRSSGQFQTPTLQHSGVSALKTQVCSEVDFTSSKQPQVWLVDHCPDIPSSVRLPSEHLLPSFQHRPKILKTSQGLDDVFVRRDQIQKTQDFRVPKDSIQAKNHRVFHPSDERKEFVGSRATCQEERSGSRRPSTLSSTLFKDAAMTECQSSLDMPGKSQDPLDRYLKKIIRHVLHYLSLNPKDKGVEDLLKNERSPPANVTTQESVTREKLIYSMASEVQYLMNIVVQILVKWLGLKVGDLPEAQWCKVEPLTPQVGDSRHSSAGLYDSKNRRPTRIMSSGDTSPKSHSHPFTYKGIRDKRQLVASAHRVCDQHQNRGKMGMGYGQVPTPQGNSRPCRYRGIADKPQSHAASQRAYASDSIIMKRGMGCCPHSSTKGHNPLFMHRDIRDTQQSGIVYRASNSHQSTKKGVGYGHLIRTKENNHPVTYWGTRDKEQSHAAGQRAGHPRCTSPA